MDLQLTGKIAVVTGASRGIGKAIAQNLSTEGMKVALVARSTRLLEELADTLANDSLVIPADLRDSSSPGHIVSMCIEKFGKIDLLVNNAGATVRGDFLTLSDDEWQDGFALKFFGAMRCCRAAWPFLRHSRGAIVNIVGIGGRTGSAEFAIGGAVNAALLNLTKALADRGIQDGVRVNAINPGSILTDRLQKRIAKFAMETEMDPLDAANELAKTMKIERFGDPNEIARAVAFLASDLAGYCHGAILDIDGGQTRTL